MPRDEEERQDVAGAHLRFASMEALVPLELANNDCFEEVVEIGVTQEGREGKHLKFKAVPLVVDHTGAGVGQLPCMLPLDTTAANLTMQEGFHE